MTDRTRLLWAAVLFVGFFGMAWGLGSVEGLGDVLGSGAWIGESAFTHLAMLGGAVVLILALGRRDLAAWGFRSAPARDMLKAVLAGGVTVVAASMVPMTLLVVLGGPRMVGEGMGPVRDLTPLQMFTSVLILASIAEEVLYRGLIQSFLAPLRARGVRLLRVRLSAPVLFAGVTFGLSHLILIPSTPAPMVAVIVFAAAVLGLVAGSFRERTGSLLPAIAVHMVFNVPGMVGKLVQSAVGA